MVAAKVTKKDKPKYFLSRPDFTLSKFLDNIFMERTHEIGEADIVVFGGGADINPFLYGEKRHMTTVVSYPCDMRDIEVLRKCGKYQPKVGVCRGGQFLNVMVGNGRLFQNVTNHGLAGTHEIKRIDDASAHLPLLVDVTSTHHQMMIPGDKATILYAANKAMEKETDDAVVKYKIDTRADIFDDAEIVLYDDDYTLCYQPHPEYDTNNNQGNKELFLHCLIDNVIDDSFAGDMWSEFYSVYND